MPEPDGTQKAIAVHIFPEAQRGADKRGHDPHDRTVGAPAVVRLRVDPVTHRRHDRARITLPSPPAPPSLLTHGTAPKRASHINAAGVPRTPEVVVREQADQRVAAGAPKWMG